MASRATADGITVDTRYIMHNSNAVRDEGLFAVSQKFSSRLVRALV
jgi:hypothetical protein